MRIIGILLFQEACVCDMQRVLGLAQPLLSRHLAYLRSAGLIRDRRVGTRIYCSLALEGEVGRALREFLQTIMPHFGPFHEDALRMKAHVERSGWMRRGVSDSAQSENRRSGKEGDNEDQSSSVQL
ncbi:MAG: helix-turn-helix transcriptional regulator [Acidobacteria bacterium]|nr:helix-turn-helix transcriptional regulator [Acidobacteriota bacterium]